MSLKDDICSHDAPMQPRRVTHHGILIHGQGDALVHHANPSGVSQPGRVVMMLECSTGELFASAAFMHHDDQGNDALMY